MLAHCHLIIVAILFAAGLARGQGAASCWGGNDFGQLNAPSLGAGLSFVDVDAGYSHTVGLLSNGAIVAWGYNGSGQSNPPGLPNGMQYLAVAAGATHSIALLSNGNVYGWGSNQWGQTDAPILPAGLSYVLIDAGGSLSVAVRSDGAIVAWGYNASAPGSPPQGTSITEISTSGSHSLALLSSGEIMSWGANGNGQCDVPPLPSGMLYTRVVTGDSHSAALRSDGQIVAWGGNTSGQVAVPPLPASLTYLDVGSGPNHLLALRSDGQTIAWGNNQWGQCIPTPLPVGIIRVHLTGGDRHSVGVTQVADCGIAATYCTAGTTVHGCVPSIAGIGAPSSIAPSGFDIVVSNVEGQRYGLIYYGFYPVAVPWSPASTSYRCVSFPMQRTPIVDSSGTAGQCNGELRLDFNAWRAANPGGLGNPFVAGQVFYAQGWFRDPGAPKQTNLSDGLRFVLCD